MHYSLIKLSFLSIVIYVILRVTVWDFKFKLCRLTGETIRLTKFDLDISNRYRNNNYLTKITLGQIDRKLSKKWLHVIR